MNRSLSLAAFLLLGAALPVETSVATPSLADTCSTSLTEVQTSCDCGGVTCTVVKTLTPTSLDDCEGCKLVYHIWINCGGAPCSYKDVGEMTIDCNSSERLQEACPGNPHDNILNILFACGGCE
ncbi:MAG: hypothetical protein H6828_15780 [Planctomycetes bacterium]|nr:hypothetical protein [Planctomycetota bacterium]